MDTDNSADWRLMLERLGQDTFICFFFFLDLFEIPFFSIDMPAA